ncbi:hypothetical protein HJD18_10255 [Thermoleophilia bacterium SCSIO 60948]|nr:hypothetical protein HJD18_10255 [Thermoleophilia bacterium SCSIO 60948]
MKRVIGLLAVAATFGALGASLLAAPASAAEVKQFGVGDAFSCALAKTGKVTCWGGEPSYGLENEPTAKFEQLTVGNYHACALKRSGRAVCWGDPSVNATKAPGRWRRLTAGYYGNCGVRPTGKVDCFGYDPYRDGVPGGKFRSVSMGGDFACGLRPSGRVECWGEDEEGQTMAPTGEFKSVTTGAYSACAQKRSGRLSCWGSDEDGLVSQLDRKIAGQTRVGWRNYCALPKGGGSLICGGDFSEPVADPAPGRFIGVSLYAFSDHACALHRDRTLACWGENPYGGTDVPRAFLPTER